VNLEIWKFGNLGNLNLVTTIGEKDRDRKTEKT